MDTHAFDEAYKTLTKAQKEAVDTVEGPVLVVAGPGTGKTHVLTLRIANILKTTDAKPEQILVLTFTDSAAHTARTRVKKYVGERTGEKIMFSTFHGFADRVIHEHLESFPEWKDKRLMSDVEATILWREVFETVPLTLLGSSKSPFHALPEIAKLYDDLRRECISHDDYRAFKKEEEERLLADPKLRYVRGGKGGDAGELKPEGHEKIARLTKIDEAITLMEAYEALKNERGLADFSDVLFALVEALSHDSVLVADLQETFQYILADEHQDANRLQHALLDALSFDDHPNLFVVGDEKQAIYRFQGADSSHFEEFTRKYPRALVVTLTDSFRSNEGMLSLAYDFAVSMLPTSTREHARLKAFREAESSKLLLRAPDPLQEREQVATMVANLIASNVPPHEIAVIGSTNKTISLFSQHLVARGVPTLKAGDISLTERASIRALLALCKTVADPLDIASLRESLLAPWITTSIEERALLLRTTRDRELWESLHTALPHEQKLIQELRQDALSRSPIEVFTKLLALSGARDWYLAHPEGIAELPLVHKLFSHIENIGAEKGYESFARVIDALAKGLSHGYSTVKTTLLSEEGKITVITAHKAKGMEFQHVFIVGLTESEWEKGGRAKTVPSPIDTKKTLDDAARQFYVALTRAKDAVVLSYPLESVEGRAKKPSVLIPEGLTEIEALTVPTLPVMHETKQGSELIGALTRRYLTHDGLSPSALNEYLTSPPTFFAKRVLRLKEAENLAMVIGTAVHAGVASFLTYRDEDRAFGALHASITKSLLARNTTYDTLTASAVRRLHAFLASPFREATALHIEETFSKREVHEGVEVLLSGKADAVISYGGRTLLVDFKTSSKGKSGVKLYQLQLAFYDYLLKEMGISLDGAAIIEIGESDVALYDVPLDEVRTELTGTLNEVLKELLQNTWREGEESEYDALLSHFTT
jgi:DNA helicase-2/ATP-dependent DNA helicase PcrA